MLETDQAMESADGQSIERKACQTCAVAKAKCILPTDNLAGDVKCERCARLKKPCAPQPPPSRKKKVPKQTLSRGAQMERKLEDIAQLLATRGVPDGLDASINLEGIATAQANNPLPHLWVQRAPVVQRAQPHWESASQSADNVFNGQVLPSVKLTYQEMEEAIDAWRPQLAARYPFAALDDSESTKLLMVERPFMATAIAVAAVYGDLPRQLELAEGFIKDVGHAMLVEGKKTLDLLQGILVLLAWYHYHVYKNPQTSNLMHLAAALLVDLGLSRPPDRLKAQKAQYFFRSMAHGPSVNKEIRNLPERRALAGCYYLSSVIWCTFKRLDPIPYTNHVHEAVDQIEKAAELPSDRLLVWLVRAQLLFETIERDLDVQQSLDTADSATPAIEYVDSYSDQLEEFMRSLPSDLRTNCYLVLIYHIARLTMFESAFVYIDAIPSSRGTDQDVRASRRREYVISCLESIKDVEAVFIAEIDPSDFYSQAFDLWARTSLAMLALARIFLRRDLGDLYTQIRATVDFEAMLERYAQAWEKACATAKYQGLPLGNNHLFERWAWRLRLFKDHNKHVHDPLHLPRANTEATFPGDDRSMHNEMPLARSLTLSSQAAVEARKRVIQELNADGDVEDIDTDGEITDDGRWHTSMVDLDEHSAIQCPTS